MPSGNENTRIPLLVTMVECRVCLSLSTWLVCRRHALVLSRLVMECKRLGRPKKSSSTGRSLAFARDSPVPDQIDGKGHRGAIDRRANEVRTLSIRAFDHAEVSMTCAAKLCLYLS